MFNSLRPLLEIITSLVADVKVVAYLNRVNEVGLTMISKLTQLNRNPREFNTIHT